MDLTGIVRTLDENEFITGKNVMAGTSDKISAKLFLFKGNKISLEEVEVIPAINKVIDELIVNSIDHFVLCLTKGTIQHRLKVSEPSRYVDLLGFSVDNSDGRMAIINTGYGIPISRMQEYGGMYLPQVLFSKSRTGTNMDSDDRRITGGTNGVGATIVTAFSKEMQLDIRDKDNVYEQHMNKKVKGKTTTWDFDEPRVIANTNPNSQYTKISFLIDWKSTKYRSYTGKVSELIISYVHKRLMQTSLYANHVLELTGNKGIVPEMKVSLKIKAQKDVNIPISYKLDNIEQLSTTFGFFKCFLIKLNRKKPSAVPLTDTINVLIGVNNREQLCYREMSIVNGIEVTRNPYMAAIRKHLLNAIKQYCLQKNVQWGKKSPKSFFTLISIMCMCNPQWVGQTKEEINVNKEDIDSFGIGTACNAVKDQISEIVYEMIVYNEMNSNTVKRKAIKADTKVYKKCDNLDERHNPIEKNIVQYLILCEGASASSLLGAVVDRGYRLNHKNTGFLTTTGVPMNVYHRMNICSTKNFKHVQLSLGEQDKEKLIIDRKLEENKFYEQWCLATGLKGDKLKYDEIIRQMKYGYLVCATDSDYDGWNIAGLFMVLLSKYDGLLENKHFKILHLPIIRVIPKNLDELVRQEKRRTGKKFLSEAFIRKITYREYFTIRDYEEDSKVNPVPASHIIKYYKGLATTDEFFKDVIAIDMDKYLFTVHADKKYKETIKHFYGKFEIVEDENGDPITLNLADKRKEILREPLREMTEAELEAYKRKFFTITAYLEIHVKQYYLDNIRRKIPHIMDGCNEAMRKVLLVAPKKIREDTKVSIIASKIAVDSGYHHGPASMEGVITNLGSDFFGARLFSPFITSGQWGSILDGGKNPGSLGSSRYIEAKINKRFIELMLRHEDNIILEHQESEGKSIEPKFFLPIIPYVILDNYGTAAHGWKCEIWGRCFNSVFVTLIKMLRSIDPVTGLSSYDPRNSRLDIDPRNRNGPDDLECVTISDLDKDENVISSKTVYYSKGKYEVIPGAMLGGVKQPDIIHISALPVGVWIQDYVNKINNKVSGEDETVKRELADIVREAVSHQNESVDISIRMHDGWQSKLNKLAKKEIGQEIDVIETIFQLKIRLVDSLNLINVDDTVSSYNSYEDIFYDWFYKRFNFYHKRIEREIIIIKLKLLIARNKVKYLQLFSAEKLFDIPESEFVAKLKDANLCPLREIPFESNFRCNNISNDKIIQFATTQLEDENDCILLKELISHKVTTEKISYGYLKNIATGRITKKGIAALNDDIAVLETRLAKLEQPNSVINTWLSELNELFQYIRNRDN